MFVEKKRLGVSPRPLTVDGSVHGLVHVSDARGFYVKQKVYLKSATQPDLLVEIKRFNSLTSFYVGPLPPDGKIKDRTDVSAYTVADGASIGASEQDRPGIKEDEHERAVYMEEPVVAKRTILVDELGALYGKDNPIPVSAPAAGMAPGSFDEVNIVRDFDDNPIQYEFKLNGTIVGKIDVSYNVSSSAVKYKKV